MYSTFQYFFVKPVVLNYPHHYPTRGTMSTELNSFHGISLHVSVTIAPEHIDEFLPHFKACFDAVTAEPECIFFEVFHDAEHPGHFHWVEDWNKDVEVRYTSELLFLNRIVFWVAERRRSGHFCRP